MTIGEKIREARKSKGWSQRLLAQRIDSDASYINRIETGKLNPSVVGLQRIADALECSLDQLVRGKDNDPEVHIRDKGVLERMRLIDSLEEADRNALIHIIDSMLTKQRMRELLDGKLLQGTQ